MDRYQYELAACCPNRITTRGKTQDKKEGAVEIVQKQIVTTSTTSISHQYVKTM